MGAFLSNTISFLRLKRTCCSWWIIKWMFPKIVAFPPKSSILLGFSSINHPFWGTTIFGNTQICSQRISGTILYYQPKQCTIIRGSPSNFTIDLQSLEKLPWILICLNLPKWVIFNYPRYFSLSSRFCCNFLIISLPKKESKGSAAGNKNIEMVSFHYSKAYQKHIKTYQI